MPRAQGPKRTKPPGSSRPTRRRATRAVPQRMAWLFPEVDVAALDARTHPRTILARVLERGTWTDVQWVLGRYGREGVRAFFRAGAPPDVSPRTRRYWAVVFQEDESTWPALPPFRQHSSALFPE